MVADLVGTQIDLGIADVGTPAAFVKTGRRKTLVASGKERSPVLPKVPTFAERGVAGMKPFSSWLAVLAPAGVPKPIVDRLSAEIVKILRAQEVPARLHTLGFVPTGTDAAAGDQILTTELERWRAIIADVPDIKLD